MNTLVVGDPHLKVANLSLAVEFIIWLENVIEDLDPDTVVILGDVFHTHNVVRSEIMALLNDFLTRASQQYASKKLYPCFFILVGNHDMAHHKTPDIHAWLPFKGKFKNVFIIDKPSTMFGMIPYIDDPEEFKQAFDSMRDKPVIFCHQTFRGANFGFVTSKEGAVVPTDYPGQIISGHIHKGQDLGCVWYPGTPFAQEASDHNEVKGIYLYDQESRKRTFIKSPLPQWVTSKAAPANFAEVIAKMDKTNRNHLVIEGPGPEVSAVVDSKQFKELKKEYGFSVKKVSTSTDKSTKSLKKVSTVEDAVVEYVDRIYDGAVDREQLKARCLAALQ